MRRSIYVIACAMAYTMSFHKQVALADGTRLELRAIAPSDKTALTEGFAQLSAQSRRRRFHTAKTALSEADLRFLTECDGHTHFAIVATCEDALTGKSVGVGVARYVRMPDNPAIAELAITVVDAWQHRGIGELLLRHIVAAATEHQVERFAAVILADNEGIKHLIGSYSGDAKFRREHGVLILDIPIGSQSRTDQAL